jgi:hypothetical protein
MEPLKYNPDLDTLKDARPVVALIELWCPSLHVRMIWNRSGPKLLAMSVPYFVRNLYYLVYFLIKITIYITQNFILIFILIEKCIINKFCHCEKFQFITV